MAAAAPRESRRRAAQGREGKGTSRRKKLKKEYNPLDPPHARGSQSRSSSFFVISFSRPCLEVQKAGIVTPSQIREIPSFPDLSSIRKACHSYLVLIHSPLSTLRSPYFLTHSLTLSHPHTHTSRACLSSSHLTGQTNILLKTRAKPLGSSTARPRHVQCPRYRVYCPVCVSFSSKTRGADPTDSTRRRRLLTQAHIPIPIRLTATTRHNPAGHESRSNRASVIADLPIRVGFRGHL